MLASGIATDFFSVVSNDDGLPIGAPVAEGYKVISNEKLWDLVSDALGSTKHEIVSVGTIGNRQKGFISVKLDDNFKAAERDTEAVLNVLWGHGGKMSVQARSGFTVVVCQNTFSIALKEKSDFNFRVKHTGNADQKLEGMKDALESHYAAVDVFKAAMDKFVKQGITVKEARALFAGFIVREDDFEKVSTRTANQIETLTTLFHSGKGNNGKDYSDVFNATTDYFTHESSGGENVWKQVESSEFGAGKTRKSEMFELLEGKAIECGDLKAVMARGSKVLDSL